MSGQKLSKLFFLWFIKYQEFLFNVCCITLHKLLCPSPPSSSFNRMGKAMVHRVFTVEIFCYFFVYIMYLYGYVTLCILLKSKFAYLGFVTNFTVHAFFLSFVAHFFGSFVMTL